MQYNPDLRKPVPRCDETHPDRRQARQSCPKCRAWISYTTTIRRDAIAAGQWTVKPRSKQKTVKREPRCDDHVRGVAGCPPCQGWWRYQSALRRLELNAGTLRRNADQRTAQEHLRRLTDYQTGGWSLADLAAHSGVPRRCLTDIINGRRISGKIFAITAESILAVQPRGKRSFRKDLVPSAEVRRIHQGLLAQGWTFHHQANLIGLASRGGVRAICESQWVSSHTVDRARLLRDKLGPYDINELPSPLPGMSWRCANYAARKGWPALHDWDGVDITDPTAEPFRVEPHVEAELAIAGRLLIDYPAIDRRMRGDTTARLNWMEMAALVDRASAPDDDGNPTHSATEIGAMLGYPQNSDMQRKVGARQASRIRAILTEARAWLDGEPAGAAPEWLTPPVRQNGPATGVRYLPALMAVLPAPFGRGMPVAQLAERCGIDVTVDQVNEFVTEGAAAAATPWTIRSQRPERKRARKGKRHPAQRSAPPSQGTTRRAA